MEEKLATIEHKLDTLIENFGIHAKSDEAHWEVIKEHMLETRPVLDGLNGTKVVGSALMWLGALGASFLALKEVFRL